MKSNFWLLVLILFFSYGAVKAQKKNIDFAAIENWVSISNVTLSNNGNYLFYNIKNNNLSIDTFTLRSTKYDWKLNFTEGIKKAAFAYNSKYTLLITASDTLNIIPTGKSLIRYVGNVSDFTVPEEGNSKYLLFKRIGKDKELVLYDLENDSQRVLSDVDDYCISSNGAYLFVKSRSLVDSLCHLIRIELSTGRSVDIIKEKNITNITFDKNNLQTAFITSTGTTNSIWLYNISQNSSELLLNDSIIKTSNGMVINLITNFSTDGNLIYFTLKSAKKAILPNPNYPKVDVWSYHDTKLQSQQLKLSTLSKDFKTAIEIKSKRLIKIEDERHKSIKNAGGYELIRQMAEEIDPGENDWNLAGRKTYFLLSLNSGKKIQLSIENVHVIDLSPEGNYLLYFDAERKDYFSISTNTSNTSLTNVTAGINTPWREVDIANNKSGLCKILGWAKNDSCLYLQDGFDIWMIHLNAKKSPINLTAGYGRKSNIIFDFVNKNSARVISSDDKLFLHGFDRTDKQTGYFSIKNGISSLPVQLTLGPYSYSSQPLYSNFSARNTFIVSRESEKLANNLFVTHDFKVLRQITHIAPEKVYNWLTTELITWKTDDGIELSGILYKPENFDVGKKYPIIINYYERTSDNLHKYLHPDYTRGEIDISYFVSNGYLVFTPDIHFKIGEPGKSCLKAIMSAVNILGDYPWFAKNRIGIYGHSFGGFETNYLITHTDIFKAACSAAGISDLVSLYGDIFMAGPSRQASCERGQFRIGAKLWERADLYIENSPIFRVDKVNTPLLMMNNKGDIAVPFNQGVEFFTGLRRLQKKVWMLQYDNENHILFGNIAAKDYTIRVMQFFDHFLKGEPAPEWMVKGIKSSQKGIDLGLNPHLLTGN